MGTECKLFPQSERRGQFPDASLRHGRSLNPDSSPDPGESRPLARGMLLTRVRRREQGREHIPPLAYGCRGLTMSSALPSRNADSLGTCHPKRIQAPRAGQACPVLPTPPPPPRPLAPRNFAVPDTTACEMQILTSGNYLRASSRCFK